MRIRLRRPVRSPSNGKLVSLQSLLQDNGRRDDRSSSFDRRLTVRPPAKPILTSRYSGFKLPDDWIVEVVPRRQNPCHIDRYYYEPGTGKKFRSLREVERYFNGEGYPSRSRDSRALVPRSNFQRSRCSRHVIYGGQAIELTGKESNPRELATLYSSANAATAAAHLPDGWIIEKVPRRLGGSDKYYSEPGTGRQFRSLVSVHRYLEGLKEDMPLCSYIEEIKENVPLSKAFKLDHKEKNFSSRKTNYARSGTQISSFVSPPKKVKWTLGSPGGDVWNAFIFDAPVPDSVKEQWHQRFMTVMKDNA